MITRLLITCAVLTFSYAAGQEAQSQADSDDYMSSDNFPYTAQLDPNYKLQWKFNSTHIVFKAHVRTSGYIGLGISKNGGMYPADVSVSWVKNGDAQISDRHTAGYFEPIVDDKQDWILLEGSEKDGYTTITMIRKLNTCDGDDIEIKDGTTRIIFSYNDADPTTTGGIIYHGMNRGSSSILLLKPSTNFREKVTLPNDTFVVDFVKSNYSVPSNRTTYSCRIFQFPKLDGKHHIIRYEGKIQKGHETLVHHMVLYSCKDQPPQNKMQTDYKCYVPGRADSCNAVFFAWAIGGAPFNFPSHVGHPVGGPDDPTFFRLEIHYDNPQSRTDFVDNSGFRFYLTKQLRKHDSGVLNVGKAVDYFQLIPPHAPHFLSRGFCTENCLRKGLGDKKINIFADLLHAHLLGSAIKTRHLRNGKELEPIYEDTSYDFNFQQTVMLNQERLVQKGDVLFTDCIYDSTKRNYVTVGGLGTDSEMCMSFLLYYPRIPLSECGSSLALARNLQEAPMVLKKIFATDFTKQSARDSLARILAKANIVPYCDFNDQGYGAVEPRPNFSSLNVTKENECQQ